MKIEALIYARVSSKRQEEEGGGLDSQEAICREFCERKGLPVTGVFKEAYSGGSAMRDGLNGLIAHVKARPATKHVVVFDDISRLNRNLSNHLEITEVLRENLGCVLMSPSREFKGDADSKLVENLLASIAEHGRKKNEEQVRARMRGQLLDGNWVFRLPYGYLRTSRKNGNRPTIIKDEPHFSIIKAALNGFASGAYNSQADVMRYLESEPAFLKASKAFKVHIQKVDSLLRNPFYSGQIVYEPWGVSLRKARHKAAIDYETDQKILAKLDGDKKVFCSNRDGAPPPVGTSFVLIVGITLQPLGPRGVRKNIHTTTAMDQIALFVRNPFHAPTYMKIFVLC